MIILITGASHTGKTLLAQKLLEKYQYPYLSIDLLKMGLIRSGCTSLTPYDDDKLTAYLWNICKEIIKTAVENHQNLIVEGCYIPFDWKKDFSPEYLDHIRYCCLVMSENYIKVHFDDMKRYSDIIEKRLDDSDFTLDNALTSNRFYLQKCIEFGLNYTLIDEEYSIDFAFPE